MKEIKLTQGKVALVDDEDFEFLSQWKWFAVKDVSTYYAARTTGRINGKRIKISMHRLILGLYDRKIECDHVDHNGLNNQRYNLRIATQSQNAFNRRSRKNSLSAFLGVNWDGSSKKWLARIQKKGERKRLGLFENEIDAALAYNKAAIDMFGEFANLNEIAV